MRLSSVLLTSQMLHTYTVMFPVHWRLSLKCDSPAAMQFSPLLKKTDCAPWKNTPHTNNLHDRLVGERRLTCLTALSRSQSLKIMSGDLPPSSSDTFFTLLSAALCESNYYIHVNIHLFMMGPDKPVIPRQQRFSSLLALISREGIHMHCILHGGYSL